MNESKAIRYRKRNKEIDFIHKPNFQKRMSITAKLKIRQISFYKRENHIPYNDSNDVFLRKNVFI